MSTSDIVKQFAAWADCRIGEMLAAPQMWGEGLEAIELQILTLLEARAFVMSPQRELQNPRRVLEAYAALLAERFGGEPPRPLYHLVNDESRFAQALASLIEPLREEVASGRDGFFSENHLGIELNFKPGTPPPAQAVTKYYVGFCQAARALARGTGKQTGRVGKPIENATDFELSNVSVTPHNGVPAQVRIGLGGPLGQGDMVAGEEVKRALYRMLDLGERANAATELGLLPAGSDHGAERTTRLLVQTLRVLPRGNIETVKIGGAFVDRASPVLFLARHEPVLRAALAQRLQPRRYDETADIRAVDLDRRSFGHAVSPRRRVTCYLRQGDVENLVSQAGVRAHVVGQLYREKGGGSFVIVESVKMV